MTFSQDVHERLRQSQFINTWLRQEEDNLNTLYTEEKNNLDREPKNYGSNVEALQALSEIKNEELQKIRMRGQRSFTIADIAEVLVKEIAMTVMPDDDNDTRSVIVYDYDSKMYKHSTKFLNDCLVLLYGQSSNSILSSLIITLSGLWYKMAIYNPLPEYKIAVGNGIYNLITKELTDFTPKYTVLEKIATNYNENAEHPVYNDGFTFEQMVNDFSNDNENRKRLLYQIFKSIVTGINTNPGLFIILGRGGDGKSTMFQMIANMIGSENVAYLNFRDFGSHDKLITAMNKKLILGLDNGIKLYIKDTTIVKTMASHETITLSRKYLPAITFKLNAVVVQLCNEMPRFAETGNSMRRRLIPYKAEKNFNQLGIENRNIDMKYIKDSNFLEYVLKFILDEIDYHADYNDVDRKISQDALESEDLVGQFLNDIILQSEFDDVKKLPISHLYAAYKDWMQRDNEDTNPLANRTFIIQAQNHLIDFGFDISDVRDKIRPLTLEAEKEYNVNLLDEWKESHNLKNSIELNSASRYFYRREDQQNLYQTKRQEVRRNDKVIDIIRYLKLEDEIPGYRNFEKDYLNFEQEVSENSDNSDNSTKLNNNEDNCKFTVLDLKKAFEDKDNETLDNFFKALEDQDFYKRNLNIQDEILKIAHTYIRKENQTYLMGYYLDAQQSTGADKIKKLKKIKDLILGIKK